MPIHEYICNVCEERTEKLEKMDEFALDNTPCTECQVGTLKKTISAGVFNLKGKGFYKNGMN